MLFLASQAADLENISLLNAGIVAVLGYALVFVGLIALMVVVIALGKVFSRKEKKSQQDPDPVEPAAEAPAPVVSDAAPGTAGQLKLYDTPPKTAAMIMAIVADTTGKPLNELRFISIKEVK